MSTPSMSIPEPQSFDSLLSLKGRCAVVTGGSRGLGEAIVHRLTQAGASVVLTGRGREALDRVEKQITATGGHALGVQADMASLTDSQKVIDQAVERFGRVDILINNAAVFPPSIFIEVSEKTFDYTVDADLKGAFFLAQFAAKAMIADGRGGKIINVLSNDAFRPTGILSAYGAAKLGMLSATQAMAKELAPHQILVNALTPGSIITQERLDRLKLTGGLMDQYGVPGEAVKTMEKMAAMASSGSFEKMMTAMMPLGRRGFPDEIATAALFLASDMAKYISGTNLVVDGAQSWR
jgi:NAD(P)-dependent dehydrogenase (short-subunit alcohol dehydrogenase family)